MRFQTDFTIDELRSRRAALCEHIGDATAVVVGAPASDGTMPFRQYNDFYYLCGVEVPHAYLMIDGRSRRTTLYLPEAEWLVRDSDDPLLCADDPGAAGQTTGVDAVKGRGALAEDIKGVKKLFTFLRSGEGLKACVRSLGDARRVIDADPWDGRPDRGAYFVERLKTRHPQIEIADLAPIVYEMRMIKSPREIELLRRAGQLSALGLRKAMRSTRPGVMEYQLAAVLEYVYRVGGALDNGYHPIVGGGKNAYYGHYNANGDPLLDGDMLLVDCAPDYHYYTSDITRMWPVNGMFTPAQRAIYGYVTEYHKTLLAAIRPGRTCDEIEEEAVARMQARLPEFDFASDAHAGGPQWMFNFRKHLAHSVGMSVHDGLSHKTGPLKSGMVFAVDPQMKIEEDRLYLRVEDTIAVTDDGIEVLTGDIPHELDEIEALVTGDGIVQACPPPWQDG